MTPAITITAIETSVEVARALEALVALQFEALPPLMLPEFLPLVPLMVVLRESHFASAEQERRSNCERAQGAFQ
jgi:hypothetical protein